MEHSISDVQQVGVPELGRYQGYVLGTTASEGPEPSSLCPRPHYPEPDQNQDGGRERKRGIEREREEREREIGQRREREKERDEGRERGKERDYKFMRFPVKKNTIVVPTV